MRAVYGAQGATKNFAPAEGTAAEQIFADVAWVYALLLALVAGLVVVAVHSFVIAATTC